MRSYWYAFTAFATSCLAIVAAMASVRALLYGELVGAAAFAALGRILLWDARREFDKGA